MNRIIQINIKGMLFMVDESAYDLLRQYIESLRIHFKNTDGGDEIMSDIELRIAEMLQEHRKTREVILPENVHTIIAALGRPEDMDDTENVDEKTFEEPAFDVRNKSRRVYRNPDDRILGGVCSGVSAYFDIDPLWLRLAFVIALFFGAGFLLYIILWIIIPEAKTNAEKLAMRGEAVNLSNLSKKAREEAESVKKNFNNWRHKNIDNQKFTGFVYDVGNRFLNALQQIFKVLGKIFGALLVFISSVVLFSLIALFLAVAGIIPSQTPITPADIFPSISWMWLGISSSFILLFLPFLGLLFSGLYLLFNLKTNNKPLNIALVSIWILAVFGAGFTTLRTLAHYQYSNIYETTNRLNTIEGDTLYIKFQHNKNSKNLNLNNAFYTNLQIRNSKDSSIYLIQENIAHAESPEMADEMSRNILYSFEQKEDTILLPNSFSLYEKTGWHAERVNLILEIPQNKQSIVSGKRKHLHYHVGSHSRTKTVKIKPFGIEVKTIETK